MGKNHQLPSPAFGIPDGYFDTFKERLDAQMELEALIGTDCPSGFVVPENYFDSLSLKRNPPTVTPSKVITLFSPKAFGMVATIAAILVFYFTVWKSDTTTDGLEHMDLMLIADYIEFESLELSSYELGAMLSEEELNAIQPETALPEEALFQYLETTLTEEELWLQNDIL